MSPATPAVSARAAVLRQAGQPFSVENIEVAAPRADEVRVRLAGVGICHTDLVMRDGFPVPLPIVLGHEGSGVVDQVGAEVHGIQPGDHVVLSFNSCTHCPNCSSHQPAYCYEFGPLNLAGVRLSDGSTPLSQNGTAVHGNFFGQSSFASYAIARAHNTVVVRKDLPLALLGPLGCGIQTGAGAVIKSLGVKAGMSLVIFGGGAVGLSGLMAARAMDAGLVIVIEPKAERRVLARELGAHEVLDPFAEPDLVGRIKTLSGGGVQRVMETTGLPPVIAQAAQLLRPNGILGLLGASPMEATLPINIMSVLLGGIGIKGILEGDSDPQRFIPELLSLHRAGRFPFDRLIKTFPFEQINEAAHASESGAVIKPVLLF